MEPHASTAVWEGDKLTLYTSNQILHWAEEGVAATLQMPEGEASASQPYIGGGFGSKLVVYGSDACWRAGARRRAAR
jgi:xanthine dehydrogenase YagR molybdenum-binding subunit